VELQPQGGGRTEGARSPGEGLAAAPGDWLGSSGPELGHTATPKCYSGCDKWSLFWGATKRLQVEHPTTTEQEKRKKRRGENGSQPVCCGRNNEEKHELSKHHTSCIVLDILKIYILLISERKGEGETETSMMRENH
jgi:hypothetical protein